MRPTLPCLPVIFFLLACAPKELPTSIPAPPGGGDESWLVQTTLQGPSGRTSYVQLVSSLELGTVDNSRGVELVGNGRIFLRDVDHLFLGSIEAPMVTHYVPQDDGSFNAAEQVSFQRAGFGYLPWGNLFASAEEAVLADGVSLTAVRWNPSARTVGDTIDLSALKKSGVELSIDPGVVRGRQLYFRLQYTNADLLDATTGVHVLVLNADDGSTRVVSDERCTGGYSRLVLAEDDTLYVVGDGYGGLSRVVSNSPTPTCVLRMNPGEDTFDPDWKRSLPDALGGRDGTGLVYAGNGIAYVPAVYPERLPSNPRADVFATLEKDAAKWWRVDLTTGVGTELELPFHSLATSVGFVHDGRVLLVVPEQSQKGTTRLFEVDASSTAATLRGTFTGMVTHLERLR